jgi:hypothetical protein
MNQHTGRTESKSIAGRYIEVLPSGHATVYQNGGLVRDIVLTEDATAEALQELINEGGPAQKMVWVPIAKGEEILMTPADISYIAAEVLSIQATRRSGRQREALKAMTELMATEPELKWVDFVRIMEWEMLGH